MAIDKSKYEQTRDLILSGQTSNLDMSADQKVINTQILMDSLKSGTIIDPEYFFGAGVDVTHRDAETYGTLLHIAAAYGVRSVIRLILKDVNTNYLIQDFKKRYPSELAYEVARDFTVGRLLLKKEMKQAGRRIIYGPDAGKIVIGR
ncbi:MAG: hypothetical protein JKY34_03010 [Kordiimonadaceae bacterium]|nr:hypothetical protein [Kordiimonadaceae bacterium]